MPMLPRAKNAVIYPVVNEWWKNDGGVHYVAHAITAAGVAHALGEVVTGGQPGASTSSHPDQVYWSRNTKITAGIQASGGAAAIVRIEIDCSLTPCSNSQTSCVYRVPELIRGFAGLQDKPLLIYSHRDEGMAPKPRPGQPQESTKRVIQCRSSDDRVKLLAAYNNHSGWSWAS